jgi:hypothetical protein
VHFSGTAYAPLQSLDAVGQRRHGQNKSQWLKVGKLLQVRLKEYECRVVARTGEMDDQDDDGMQGNEEVGERKFDMNSEGVVRWTRVCDRRWDSDNKCFNRLPEGETVVAEESSRLVFMYVPSRLSRISPVSPRQSSSS